jgi:hypothetical protein
VASNPSPARITPALWHFVESCLALQPGTQNGGTFADKPGYHNTRNNLINQGRTNDYSVRYGPDKLGPGDKTAAFDWTFPDAQNGQYGTIIRYGERVREAHRTNDPRAYGFREVLIQADWDNDAEGYDFYLDSTRTPDSTHLWHGHFSVLRQFLNDVNAMNGMLSILAGESLETWRAGRSRYGGSAVGSTGGEDMFVAVLREPGKAERWVWSDGRSFSEITEGWLLAERRKIATKEAVHADPASFFKEVGIPFAETLPDGGDVEIELPADFEERVAARVIAALSESLESLLNRTRLAVDGQ